MLPEQLIDKYRNLIDTSFAAAERFESKLPEEILAMDGMSGRKTRHFYNNMLNTTDARYLEIGTWKGSSVCSAMYGNDAKVVCIDNWSQLGGPKADFVANFQKYKEDKDATFIEQDCFEVDVSKLPKFNIYMYDGDHTMLSHYKALTHYHDCLDDIFVFIVDDWNWAEVRNGTYEAIRKLNLNMVYGKEVRMTNDNTHTTHPLAGETWWNGICVAILQKNTS